MTASPRPPFDIALVTAAIAEGRLASAEAMLRARLGEVPADIAAITLLASLAERAGGTADAARLLRHALVLAPGDVPAREALARLLYRERALGEALAEFDMLLAAEPAHPGYRNTRAAILDLTGDQAAAAAAYRAMLADDPGQPLVWMTLGNVLKSIGDIQGAVAAFRRGVALAPGTGENWWGLANLKSFRFDDAEVAAMQAQLARPELTGTDRIVIDFALGKAFEDAGDWAGSFARYDAGNRGQTAGQRYDPAALAALTERSASLFTPAFLAGRAEAGDPSRDPIFIVGMPRSGSTLVEQILASHPAVEGTMELPELPRIARELGAGSDAYPGTLAGLSHEQLAAAGARYLARAARWRQSDRPFFIDKLPANFMSVGLIRLILPNARIIDVRRHPMACGFSIFRQYFPSGAPYSTDLGHIGRFHADYVRMMGLWEDRLPGFVHSLSFEALVADPEGTIRAMLAWLKLPFDPACLTPHANPRPVRTPSAEQVRCPIHGGTVDHWRNYEPWLGPLKTALERWST